MICLHMQQKWAFSLVRRACSALGLTLTNDYDLAILYFSCLRLHRVGYQRNPQLPLSISQSVGPQACKRLLTSLRLRIETVRAITLIRGESSNAALTGFNAVT